MMYRLGLLALVARSAGAAPSHDAKTLDAATALIKASLAEQMEARIAASKDAASCTITDDEPCDLSSLTRDATTVVYPGGETRCISENTTPYGFQVFGDSQQAPLLDAATASVSSLITVVALTADCRRRVLSLRRSGDPGRRRQAPVLLPGRRCLLGPCLDRDVIPTNPRSDSL